LKLKKKKGTWLNHGLAGWAISVASYVITSQGKMAEAMGFSVE
jgi:hypothetical protein